jgi:hypothetical protein
MILPLVLVSSFVVVGAAVEETGKWEAEPDPPHKRFEYKFSFKPPYLAQKGRLHTSSWAQNNRIGTDKK